MNAAAMNILVKLWFENSFLILGGYVYTRCRIARLHGYTMFKHLRTVKLYFKVVVPL